MNASFARVLRVLMLLLACGGLFACSEPPSELHRAAAAGDIAFVRQWIAAGRPADGSFSGRTTGIERGTTPVEGLRPLMLASQFGHLEVVQALVEARVDLYAESHCGDGECRRNAFDYAVESGQLEVARYLWEMSDRKRFGQRVEEQLPALCVRLCTEQAGGDASTNLALFLAGIAPRDKMGRAIGRISTAFGGPAQLQFLRTHAVRFPTNTLHRLARETPRESGGDPGRREQLNRATLLLDQGADPNDTSWIEGVTPLMLAAFHQNLELVTLLLQRGAQPDRRDQQGQSAVGWAAGTCFAVLADQQRQLDIVTRLIAAGARPTSTPRDQGDLVQLKCCSAPRLASPVQAEICRKLGVI